MVIQSTIKYLRELFNPKKKFTHCLYCGVLLKGKKRKFCCTPCNNSYWREVYRGEIKRMSPKHDTTQKGGQ